MANRGDEQTLLPPLMTWLRQQRRLRDDTLIAIELAWFGRRVDVATLSISGALCSYELKISDNRRALIQASYNKLAFDRSYVVTASLPRSSMLALAASEGVGVIHVTSERITTLMESKRNGVDPFLRQRLVEAVKSQGRIAQLV